MGTFPSEVQKRRKKARWGGAVIRPTDKMPKIGSNVE